MSKESKDDYNDKSLSSPKMAQGGKKSGGFKIMMPIKTKLYYAEMPD